MPNIDLSILNQRQTPAFYASSLATRPAFGFAGRIFIDTDSPSTGLYRDTGAAWVQIADPGAGTTGTLQQVTTNGKTTNQGITITAGGLNSNNISLSQNTGTVKTSALSQIMAVNDSWEIYGIGNNTTGSGEGELVFSLGDDGIPYASGGERFRFTYNTNIITGSVKDVFIVDYDLSYFNTSLGINTDTPTAAFDVHSGVSVIAQLNQTVATNNSLLAFQNNNAGLWRVGNFYNAGANDFGVFDVIGAIQPITIKKTTGQVLIGTSTVGSGKLVVASSTGDNGLQIVGASAPSLRIDNAESGPTKRAGFGISTAINNFIQGSADRDFCMFNGSTTASPILFGIYDAGTTNVREAARISPARNFLIGTTIDAGYKLQVEGFIYATGNIYSAPTSNANGLLVVNGSSGSYGGNVSFQRGGTQDGVIGTQATNNSIITGATNADICILADGGGRSIRLSTTSASPQFTLASTGNLLIGTTTDSGEKLIVNGTSKFAGSYVSFNNNGYIRCDSANWLQLQSGTNGTRIRSSDNSADYLSISDTTGVATFREAVNIGNTVSAAIAAPSTHKVSILIGGVQYYLLASNV